MGEKHTGMKRRHNLILNGGEGCVRVHSSDRAHATKALVNERASESVMLQLRTKPSALTGGGAPQRGVTSPQQKRTRRNVGIQCDLLPTAHIHGEHAQHVKSVSTLQQSSKKQNEQFAQESDPDIFNAAMMLDLDVDLGSLFDEYVENYSSSNNDSAPCDLVKQQRFEFIPETVPDTIKHDTVRQHEPPPQLEGYALPDVDTKVVRLRT